MSLSGTQVKLIVSSCVGLEKKPFWEASWLTLREARLHQHCSAPAAALVEGHELPTAASSHTRRKIHVNTIQLSRLVPPTCWTSGELNDDGTCSGACARSSVCVMTGLIDVLCLSAVTIHELGARVARHRETRRASLLQLNKETLASHTLELQEARQVTSTELHNPEHQHADTHRLLKHAVSRRRVH